LRAALCAAAASHDRKTSIRAAPFARRRSLLSQNVPDRGAYATGAADYELSRLFAVSADGAALAIPLIIHIVNDA
jgi:hypothetical protein